MTEGADSIATGVFQPGLLEGSPLVSYVYSYPHKTAHRPLRPVVPLADAWRNEPREALFLYFHVPFCETRCGFCNLFSLSRPDPELPFRYLQQVARQAERVRQAIGEAQFARLAIGGGTPTLLGMEQIRQLFAIAADVMGVPARDVPVSVEASASTISEEKLALLRELGVDRLSLGVQAFDERDAAALGRPQRQADVCRALELARRAAFPVLNIDLIYGVPAQTVDRWLQGVRRAVEYRPEEIYLYPLYVRPLTGLGGNIARRDVQEVPLGKPDLRPDVRMDCYREARSLLLDHGYRQISFRMFRSAGAPSEEGPVYCCQEDGMIGLGCGARSYTRELHYSTPYAVPRPAVRAVLEEFLARPAETFDAADHGIFLSEEDQRRRYVVLSLLQAEGLSRSAYQRRFESDALDDLPQLGELERLELAELREDRLQLTRSGMERSDAIGPWFFSDRVGKLMESYAWRTA